MSNKFIVYFTNISPSLASSIHLFITKGLHSHKHYLTNSTDTIFSFVHVTEDEIPKHISNLKTKISQVLMESLLNYLIKLI